MTEQTKDPIQLAIDALEISAGYIALVADGVEKMPILKERAKSDCVILSDALNRLHSLQSQPAAAHGCHAG